MTGTFCFPAVEWPVAKRAVGCLVILTAVFLLWGCAGQARAPEASESRALSPGEVDSSMVDRVVKVRGKVLRVTENPGGLGGIYLTLGDGKNEIGVRIQPGVWETFDAGARKQFTAGKTVTAEGVLFRAGKTLVVILGQMSPSPSPPSSAP